MKRFVLLATLTITASAEVRILKNSARALTAPALRDGKAVRANVREVQVTLQNAASKGDVLIAMDPQSGLYWWKYQISRPELTGGSADRFLSEYVLSFTGDKAVAFTFLTPTLYVREVRGAAKDMTAVQELVLAELDRVKKPLDMWAQEQFTEVEAGRALGNDFLRPAGSASELPGPVVAAVAHTAGRWEVTLKGPNGDFAVLKLDENYKLLNVTRNIQAK